MAGCQSSPVLLFGDAVIGQGLVSSQAFEADLQDWRKQYAHW